MKESSVLSLIACLCVELHVSKGI